MDLRPIRVLSLCTGVGGLDLGLRLACPDAHTVCYVENEAYGCEILAARMADGWLDDAPVWTDLRQFDGRPWRGVVDLVLVGFPCQDISSTGTRRGIVEGSRSGLWVDVARVVREVGPRYVFVENVDAVVSRGLGIVLGNLAALGYDAEWYVLGAGDVGAPHHRKRCFVLADAQRYRGERSRESRDVAGARGEVEGEARERQRRGDSADGRESPVVWLWPPGPDQRDEWDAIVSEYPDLAPAAESPIRRLAHGLATRVDRLAAAGNGVVPVQAAVAFLALHARLRG